MRGGKPGIVPSPSRQKSPVKYGSRIGPFHLFTSPKVDRLVFVFQIHPARRRVTIVFWSLRAKCQARQGGGGGAVRRDVHACTRDMTVFLCNRCSLSIRLDQFYVDQ